MFGGRVVGGYGTAGLPGLGFMNEVDLDNEESKEGHVEEISMDDFMETLIEALDTDADVFESDRQITSDPPCSKACRAFSTAKDPCPTITTFLPKKGAIQ